MVIKAGMLRRMTCEKLGWGAGRHCLRSARLFFFFSFCRKMEICSLTDLKRTRGRGKILCNLYAMVQYTCDCCQ